MNLLICSAAVDPVGVSFAASKPEKKAEPELDEKNMVL
jgi:hypothetical protein